MKLLKNLISSLLGLVVLFFALYAIFVVFIPALQAGVPFFEVVKEIAIGIYEGFKFVFGIA